MKAHTKETQATMTPQKSIEFLLEGNQRFQNNIRINRNLIEQVNDTSNGQFPFATILSCIDSRIPAEMIFDQGIGDLFSARIAGNFSNEDILGSLEFACKLAGSKVIMVLGHTSCGAVKGACDDAKLGNLTQMLAKIKPAVELVDTAPGEARNSSNLNFVNEVSRQNVLLTVEAIKRNSPVLKEMMDNNEIDIVGAMYDVESGSVELLKEYILA
ncbi:MAG: carbonic anhydrase [Saprospiraceae bacterium]|jgi:carbonic anhydrase